MLESLRGRLLLWHTAIVATVIAVFGGTVCYLVWRAGLADVDAALAARATVLSEALQRVDRDTFDLALAPAPIGDRELYHALWTPDGTLIDLSDDELLIPRPLASGARTREGRRELTLVSSSGAFVLVGHDPVGLRGELWALAALLLAAGGAVLALSIVGGWLFAGRALAPINRISGTARRMIDGDLSARIPIERVETELGQVARALNGAFDRLQASLDRQRRLSADVSHELRTPLATLSTEVQWALSREHTPATYRDSLGVCKRAASRMQSVVERLLSLARAETATAQDLNVPVRLDELVRRAVRDLTPLAANRGLTIDVDVRPREVMGDPDRLLEAVSHVLANAIAYNVPDGRITVTLTPRDGWADLAIADTGVGIAAEDLPLIFDPFFRADQARTRDAGGAGLGLAVTRSIVERHGGTVTCSSTPGQGTAIGIHLPAASHA